MTNLLDRQAQLEAAYQASADLLNERYLAACAAVPPPPVDSATGEAPPASPATTAELARLRGIYVAELQRIGDVYEKGLQDARRA